MIFEQEKTFVLEPPAVWVGGEVSEITLRAPKTKEIVKAMQNVNFNDTASLLKFQIQMVEQVSGKPKQLIDELQFTQLKEMADWLMVFFTGVQPT